MKFTKQLMFSSLAAAAMAMTCTSYDSIVSAQPAAARGVAGVIVDPSLFGVWIPQTYMYNGKPHSMDSGLMVITPRYIMADAVYDLSEVPKPEPDGNANFGTYQVVAPGMLVMQQDMQLHWRGKGGTPLVDGDGTFFNRNKAEHIAYEVNGDTLILRFQVPGEQAWILKRASAESCTPERAPKS